MSSYLRVTKNPDSNEFEQAEWLDNYFGNYRYGVRFPSTGRVFRESDRDWEFSGAGSRDLSIKRRKDGIC